MVLIYSTRLKRSADQSSSIETWRTGHRFKAKPAQSIPAAIAVEIAFEFL